MKMPNPMSMAGHTMLVTAMPSKPNVLDRKRVPVPIQNSALIHAPVPRKRMRCLTPMMTRKTGHQVVSRERTGNTPMLPISRISPTERNNRPAKMPFSGRSVRRCISFQSSEAQLTWSRAGRPWFFGEQRVITGERSLNGSGDLAQGSCCRQRHLLILGGGAAADAHRANDFAIDCHGNPTLEGQESFDGEEYGSSRSHHVLQDFCGAFEVGSCPRLVLRHGNAAGLRVVELLEQDHVPRSIHNRNRHIPVVLHGLAFGGGHHLLCSFKSDVFGCSQHNGRDGTAPRSRFTISTPQGIARGPGYALFDRCAWNRRKPEGGRVSRRLRRASRARKSPGCCFPREAVHRAFCGYSGDHRRRDAGKAPGSCRCDSNADEALRPRPS